MKGALRGFRSITSGIPSIGKPISALIGLLVFCSTTGLGQIILDNFSVDTVSHPNYDFAPVFPSDASDGWAVSGGALRPSMAENTSATWLWNQGQKLSATGDAVSISLSMSADADNGFPTSIGLFLAADRDSVFLGHEITLTTSGNFWSYSIDGSATQAASAPTGPVTVSVKRTGQSVDGFVYSVTFSGTGVPSIPDNTFTDASTSLLFGPFAYNSAGATASLDNFTFTAVPEPSTYAAAFGLLALATAVIRNRAKRV
jgi:hypothetical protein